MRAVVAAWREDPEPKRGPEERPRPDTSPPEPGVLAFLTLPSDQAALEKLEAGRFLRAGPVVPGLAVPMDEKARGRMSHVPSGPNLRELGDGTGRWRRDGKG